MAEDESDALRHWLERRAAAWQRLETQLRGQRDDRRRDTDEVMALVYGANGLGRDLALARRLIPEGRLVRHLRALYLNAQHQIRRPARRFRREAVEGVRDALPAHVEAIRPAILAVTALFLAAAAGGWLLVSRFPELGALFASQAMIDGLGQGKLWTDDLLNVTPSALLATGITTNNIIVAVSAYVLGALYGLGTLYIIGLNGLMLGGVFALTAQYDLAGRLGGFVIAHGVVEISVICVAGACGAALGEALIRPGELPRAAAFRRAAANTAPVMLACVLFLVGAGIIEGYISPDPAYTLPVRVAVGLGYWVMFLAVMSGIPWRRR
ncbi:stage II sporulation protein M [Ectothiorhodospiraceae bacterium WFHF3C12]|nr:stage II sporulation protein M [Ectothiorhodospiraceae bacterium WFHF3C12]